MEQIINRLDQWIQKARPEYYKILKPGLSDNEIKEWEIKFGFEFPQDLKALYQWKNGQPDACREYFYDYCFFDPIETIFWFSGLWERNFNEINEDGTIHWGKSWLRFMSMITSDGYCLDVNGDLGKPGGIHYFVHDDDTNENVYPGLKTMLEIIVTQFEQGAYGYEEGAFKLIDEEKSDKIYIDFMKEEGESK